VVKDKTIDVYARKQDCDKMFDRVMENQSSEFFRESLFIAMDTANKIQWEIIRKEQAERAKIIDKIPIDYNSIENVQLELTRQSYIRMLEEISGKTMKEVVGDNYEK